MGPLLPGRRVRETPMPTLDKPQCHCGEWASWLQLYFNGSSGIADHMKPMPISAVGRRDWAPLPSQLSERAGSCTQVYEAFWW